MAALGKHIRDISKAGKKSQTEGKVEKKTYACSAWLKIDAPNQDFEEF